MKLAASFFAVATTIVLASCTGITQLQDSLSRFDQSAHVVAATQGAFYGDVHAVECESQFYAAAYAYSTHQNLPLDLRGQCTADRLFLTSAQVQLRQTLLDAITLYADKLQALASAGDDKRLGDASLKVADNISELSAGFELSKADATIGRDVETALTSLMNFVLDRHKAQGVQSAALAQQDHLRTVVKALKAENVSLASGVDDLIGSIRTNMVATLAQVRAQRDPGLFFDVVRAREYLQAITPFGSRGLDSSLEPEAPDADPDLAIARLNRALDGVVSANDAIAAARTGGLAATIAELTARAQAAQAFQAAIAR